MKRPLALIGFTALCFLVFFITVESAVLSLGVLIMAGLGLVVSGFSKSKQAILCSMLCIGIVFACLLFMTGEYHRRKTLSLCGEEIYTEAVICEKPEFSHANARYYAVARLRTLSGEKAYGKIRLSFSETYDDIEADALKIGDKISFTAAVYKIGQGDSEIHKYFNSIGIYTGAYSIKNLNINPPSVRPIYHYISIVRDKIIKELNYSFDDETAGFLIAILTGDKDYVSDDTYTAFKRSGAAHIMAVSGMHLSVMVLFLSFLLDKIGRHRILNNTVLFLSVIFIMLLASFSPSVMRAGFTMLLFLVGKMLNKDADGLNSLGFASICLVLINPYIANNMGFQLSFMSVLSIFLLTLPVYEYVLGKFNNKIPTEMLKTLFSAVLLSVCISLSVTLFTFPIMVTAFGGVSLVSPLTNLLLLPVVSLIVILTALYSLLCYVPIISTILGYAVNIISFYILKVVEITSALPFAYLPANEEYIIGWAVFLFLILLSLYLLIRKNLTIGKISTAFVIVAILLSFGGQINASLSQYQIAAISGEDSSSYIVSMNGRGVLIGISEDYYFESNLAERVEELGIRFDALVCFDDTDEYEAGYVCAKYDIKSVIINSGERVVLFGQVTVENRGSYIIVEGNGIRTQIFPKEGLQAALTCDIIINNYGLQFKNNEEYLFAEESEEFVLTVGENGNYSIRGERFG